MRPPSVSVRVALAGCLLALVVLAAGAIAAGYLIEASNQRGDQARRLAAAAAYVERGAPAAGTASWQRALTGKLNALGLRAQITLVWHGGKRAVYASAGLSTTKPSTGRATSDALAATPSSPGATRPTATYQFPLAGQARTLTLDLYVPPSGLARPMLVGLASGLAALIAGTILLTWAASHWLVDPLRRLNAQVDAIAGGDPPPPRASSPIREVETVATAVADMAGRLKQTAEHDARLEGQRRLLISSIAHDLRTPLFALRGNLDAIAAGIGIPGDRLDRARAKAEQIDRLVTGLFDYARADLAERPLLHSADLATAVTEAAAAFEFVAAERGVELLVMAHGRACVLIDRDGFERALANVLDNAIRHTPRGGTVDVSCGEDAGRAFVSVADDGPGIAPDLLAGLFEFSGRPASNSRAGGAGLGLAIAARVLRNQGATIDAANAPPRGAILTLRFPAQAGPPTRGASLR